MYFLGTRPNNTNEERGWKIKKKYFAKKNREDILTGIYWSQSGFVAKEVETLGYSLEVGNKKRQ